jgi:sugar phosphate isomerase/epimerase
MAAQPLTMSNGTRRDFLVRSTAALASGWLVGAGGESAAAPGENSAAGARKLTEFPIACMTLPYAQFSRRRALHGIRDAGYQYVAWGTTHLDESGKPQPYLPAEAPPARARELAAECRDLGLEPVMLFSMVYPEHPEALPLFRSRILQAEAAEIAQVLTFGHTEGGKAELWVSRFRELGPVARDHGVTIAVKQHGGSTGTGAACLKILREIDDPGIVLNYDAGNVMDYLNVDPLADLEKCADAVRSFCIKDHRDWPRDEDCGPGFGEIDHYRLLHPVALTGRKIPLCCENIFAPLVPRPQDPAEIDKLARRAREFLETVIAGLQTPAKTN